MSDTVENSIEILKLYMKNLWSWGTLEVEWGGLNVLIGQNSSGKSNIFYAIAQSLKDRYTNAGGSSGSFQTPLLGNKTKGKIRSIFREKQNDRSIGIIGGTDIHQENSNFHRIIKSECFLNKYMKNILQTKNYFYSNIDKVLSTYSKFGKINQEGFKIFQQQRKQNQTVLISPKRSIQVEFVQDEAIYFDTNDEKGWEFEGTNVKRLLLNLKNGKDKETQDRFSKLKKRFEGLSFIKGTLVVSAEAGKSVEIYLDYGEHQVRIEDEGAGIQDVLIIMTALEIHRGNIVMIEEPETHLHPSAQRELFEVIRDYTKYSQIFISTHSPLMVNLVEPSQIYLVTMDNQGVSHLKQFTKAEEFEEIKSILGIQNSDALFANNIILVEGDSDEQVYQELLYKHKGISRAEIQFQRAKNLDKVAKVFASLFLIDLPAKGVILDADLKGKKKTETTFWKKVNSILNQQEVDFEKLKQETLVYVIDPHMEMILINSSSALGVWLDKPVDEVKAVLENSNKNPKEKIKLLLDHFELNDTITYDTSAANKIAKHMKVEEIPQEVKSLFDEYEKFSS